MTLFILTWNMLPLFLIHDDDDYDDRETASVILGVVVSRRLPFKKMIFYSECDVFRHTEGTWTGGLGGTRRREGVRQDHV